MQITKSGVPTPKEFTHTLDTPARVQRERAAGRIGREDAGGRDSAGRRGHNNRQGTGGSGFWRTQADYVGGRQEQRHGRRLLKGGRKQ
jgi:hypothetical protein